MLQDDAKEGSLLKSLRSTAFLRQVTCIKEKWFSRPCEELTELALENRAENH